MRDAQGIPQPPTRARWVLGLSTVLSLVSALAFAPVTPARAETPAPRAAPAVIELDAMVIEGKVAKPQVFYVLGRSRVQYENLKMHRVFVDRIVEGARKNPF